MSKLHRWTDRYGNEWACAAYDHGPFCRLCQYVTEDDAVLRGCLDNVDLGNFEVRANNDGSFAFKVTPKGEQEIDSLIQRSPEAFGFYMDFATRPTPSPDTGETRDV